MDFIKIVFDQFLETGKCASVKELATFSGDKEQDVRRAARKHFDGISTDVTSQDEYRISYSNHYKCITTGMHKVVVYAPSKEYLRKIILGETK